AVAHVVDEGPGAIEGGGAQIVRIPAHRVASRVAYGAVDALDGGVDGEPLGARRRDALDGIALGPTRPERALGLLPLLEERLHVAGQVLDDGQVGERADLEPAAFHHLGGVRAAGPARAAVDRHGARPAHADPAGEAVGERGVGVALHPRHHVEHRLALPQRHPVALIASVALPAPCRDIDVGPPRAYLTETWTRCTALLPKPPISQRTS